MYCQHRTRGLSQNSLSHRSQHQPVKPSPAVSSHHDQIHFLGFGEREYGVRCHSLLRDPFRLTLIVGMVLHESLEILRAFMEKVLPELFIIMRRGKGSLGMSP